ncbi:DUF423 domain-containing protein [Cytophaga sp. FL35]|uniref:DUF423 domain-containing protein n=1 Tax=Cytophaga sp. FL35 TaxID=1904456 RepID=UPI001653BF4E|nr:DUF423 domain-containing protein [Cytophaga sp. FL35]MBC6997624.1 DUF423 domain-containing protein [Cytophaga sp. FL35]
MNKTICLSGILFGMLSVVIGAFGAHGLEKVLNAEALQTFETGVKYQMYHALLLILVAVIPKVSAMAKKTIFWLLLIGIIFFSFSIYFLATNDLTAFDFRTIGFVTPIGGSLLIAAWGVFAYHVYKSFD